MAAEVINLNRARKAKARDDKAKKADENRVLHGTSKHLKQLREAGLVSVRAEGQKRLYRLEAGELAALDSWLQQFRQFWTDRLDALNDHLEKEQ